ncbi:MAG: hypothetical protein KGJ13_08415 [Patescibacteria group bacterium]|nr:hypothetical protein [Patescibacteria group bacterium]
MTNPQHETPELSELGVGPVTQLLGDQSKPSGDFIISEDEARELRDFILMSALTAENLEHYLGRKGDGKFWEDRENAYRIITRILVNGYARQFEEK